MAAPVGNKNAQKAKLWEQALKRALARAGNATVDSGLDKVADKTVNAALAGERWAIQEIGERLDGKAAQTIEHSGSIENRHVTELSADQLASELARVRALIDGTASAEGSEPEPTGIH
jgi:hypothetical protein